MKLINADALHDDLRAKKKWIIKRKGKFNVGYTYDQVHFAIDDQTTIEAIPIEWIENYIYDLNTGKQTHHLDADEYISNSDEVYYLRYLLKKWKQEKQNEE